jgi:starvation-inducible DNA-binding protein
VTTQAILRDTDLPLGAGQREIAGTQLQGTLVDLVDLALIGKQAIWNVESALSSPVSRELNKLVERWRTLADDVAERAAIIGVVPDGRARTIAGASEIESLPAGVLSESVLAETIADRLVEVAARVRDRLRRVAVRDPVTEDLLHLVAATLEEHVWIVRNQRRRSCQVMQMVS